MQQDDEDWLAWLKEKPELECLDCGHVWQQRKDTSPKACPHCRSRTYWEGSAATKARWEEELP